MNLLFCAANEAQNTVSMETATISISEFLLVAAGMRMVDAPKTIQPKYAATTIAPINVRS